MKILHIADIHFGVKFLNKSFEVRKELIKAQYESFENVINYLIVNKIDGLLIAGDFFDSDYRSIKTEKFIIEKFEALKIHNITVFYALGNHDSNQTFKSNYLSKLPENVILFANGLNKPYLFKEKVYIHSYGHSDNFENRNILSEFADKIDNYINIGLLHCSVVSNVGEEDIYLPTTINDLKSKKYDYFALGHIHKREIITENICYSGSLQGLSGKEIGPKGGILINIEENILNTEFVEFSIIDFLTINIDLENTEVDQLTLIDLIDNKIKNLRKKTILKIVFYGKSKFYEFLNKYENVLEIEEYLNENQFLLEVNLKYDEVKVNIDVNKYISDKNILGYIERIFKNKDEIDSIIKENNLKNKDEDLSDIYNEIISKMIGVKND